MRRSHAGVIRRGCSSGREARALGVTLDLAFARPALREAVHQTLTALPADPSPERIEAALALIEGAHRLGVGFGRWAAQNDFSALWRERPDAHAAFQPLAAALGFALTVEGPA